VLKAVELANRAGARTVGLTGFDGGKLGKMVEFHINVPSDSIEHVEDVHMVLDHLITSNLRLAGSAEASSQVAMRGE
jgi:D-sedoheptulose 7-phosphate isomerase